MSLKSRIEKIEQWHNPHPAKHIPLLRIVVEKEDGLVQDMTTGEMIPAADLESDSKSVIYVCPLE